MPWSLLPVATECGYDSAVIPAGQPVWQSAKQPRIRRCAVHAPEPVPFGVTSGPVATRATPFNPPEWLQVAAGFQVPR